MPAGERGVPGRTWLTEEEWAAVDAVRAGTELDAAAAAAGLDEVAFRRRLAMAGEKLRMTSSLAVAPMSAGASAVTGRMQIPHMDPCPYCENFAGRYSATSGPPAVITEDDVTFVFLTSTPLGGIPGHTLVTTRRHVETIFDLTPDEAAALGVAVARTARMLRAALDPEGLLVQQNNGAAGFQTVPHVHFHVVPKGVGPFPPVEPPPFIPPDERAALAEKLRRYWDQQP